MAPRATFGYLYDFRNPLQWRRPWTELYAETLDFIRWTESLGFDAAWIPEHHGTDDGYISSPLVALAAIAARTKTIKLGTAVALAPLYHPLRFAEECALLDILSCGRLTLTVALGYRRREMNAFGIELSSRGARMDEFVHIVRRLWSGETISYKGKYYTLSDACVMPRPLRGQIPLSFGGYSDRAIRRAVQLGDGYFGTAEGCIAYREQLSALGKDAATAQVRVLDLFFAVAKDPEEAFDALAPHYHYMNNIYAQWMHEDRTSGMSDTHILRSETADAFRSSGLLRIMTPAQAIEMLRDVLTRTSAEHVMMTVPPGFPLSKFAEYAEVFAREVIPSFC
jgi:probable F420-dependent oxidoreductase